MNAAASLPERLIEIHRALARNRVPHAFGGAIALAYWTLDPRGTSDLDVNVFVPASRPLPGLSALPEAINQPAGTEAAVARDGQVRLWWDDTPIDLFFSYEPVHDEAAKNLATVPFAGTHIPVLGPVELAVFKAIFDRTRDWADIEAMAHAKTLDVGEVTRALRRLVAVDDPRFSRLEEAAARGART